jgi:hypothetical protein
MSSHSSWDSYLNFEFAAALIGDATSMEKIASPSLRIAIIDEGSQYIEVCAHQYVRLHA